MVDTEEALARYEAGTAKRERSRIFAVGAFGVMNELPLRTFYYASRDGSPLNDFTERIMNDGRQDRSGISRRVVIARTALAVGAAATGIVATRASAQQKISQANAKYQDHPNGNNECDGCVQFQAPNACKIVEGPINPKGWCQFFGAKS